MVTALITLLAVSSCFASELPAADLSAHSLAEDDACDALAGEQCASNWAQFRASRANKVLQNEGNTAATKQRTSTERVHDVVLDNDTIIPASGKTWCVYSKLPDDYTYHTHKFSWTESNHPGWRMTMMFTISDDAVRNLTALGYDVNKPMDCDDGMPLTVSQFAGGYLMYQQAPGKGMSCEEFPDDWGMLTGKGTARRHALLRMVYAPSDTSAPDPGTGFHIHLTTDLRPISFGEAKFAALQDGNNTITIPPDCPWCIHYSVFPTQAAEEVFRGGGFEVLKVKAFGNYMVHARLLESKGGGNYSEPDFADYETCRFVHYGNMLLEDGDWEVIVDIDVPPGSEIWQDIGYTFNVTPGNSYRAECIYNTAGKSEPTYSGSGDENTACQFHMYYREIAGVNEPYPSICMDDGPWFMRTPNVTEEEASEMLAEWRQDPAHSQYPYGCPNPFGVINGMGQDLGIAY